MTNEATLFVLTRAIEKLFGMINAGKAEKDQMWRVMVTMAPATTRVKSEDLNIRILRPPVFDVGNGFEDESLGFNPYYKEECFVIEVKNKFKVNVQPLRSPEPDPTPTGTVMIEVERAFDFSEDKKE